MQSLSLYAFVQILWGISAQFPYKIGSLDLSTVPGYLVWVVLLLAVVVTIGTHLIGRQLIPLNFAKQKVEADFRYNLVRVRENSEQIALLDGEETERVGLMARFRPIFANTIAIVIRQVKLLIFTIGYQQALVVLPFVLLGAGLFHHRFDEARLPDPDLGRLRQRPAGPVLLRHGLRLDRGVQGRRQPPDLFDSAIGRAELQRAKGIRLEPRRPAPGASPASISTSRCPTAACLLTDARSPSSRGQRTLVTGPSGSGKTTLFRALAGIWPFGGGRVTVPRGEDVMLLPQQPYLPLGTLRAALAYPSDEHAFADATVTRGARQGRPVGEGRPARRRRRTGPTRCPAARSSASPWRGRSCGGRNGCSSTRRPRRSTRPSEAALYGVIGEVLPETTVVSIGHRSSLAVLHDRRVAIEPDAAGARIVDAPLEAFAAGQGLKRCQIADWKSIVP